MQSLGKVPHESIDGGTLLNIKLTPQVLAGPEGKRLSAFLKTFLDLDIFHVQFNVVSHEVAGYPGRQRDHKPAEKPWLDTAPISWS